MLPQKNPHGHCRTNRHTHTKPCWKEASWNLTEGNVLEPRWRKRALKPLLKEKQNCTNKMQTRKSLREIAVQERAHTNQKSFPRKRDKNGMLGRKQARNARKAIARKSPRNSWLGKRALSRQCKQYRIWNSVDPAPSQFGWKIQFFILIFFSFYKTPIVHFPVHT